MKTFIDFFEKLTKFPLNRMLLLFNNFIQMDMINIINYYEGSVKTPNVSSFNKMNELIDESRLCLELFKIHQENFESTGFWRLLSMVEDIELKLLTISNFNFYLKSFIEKNNFNLGVEREIYMSENNSLENIVKSELGSQDFNDDWVDLAIKNNLSEEDYSKIDGKGTILKVIFEKIDNTVDLQTVLGPSTGELLYGIDLNNKIQFIDDDLSIFSPKETIKHTIQKYLNLRVGDNPEFPNDGVQVGLFVGNNVGSLLFPVLFRQQMNLFKKDDTIYSFSIKNIKRIQDGIYIDYEIQTKYGSIYNETIKI